MYAEPEPPAYVEDCHFNAQTESYSQLHIDTLSRYYLRRKSITQYWEYTHEKEVMFQANNTPSKERMLQIKSKKSTYCKRLLKKGSSERYSPHSATLLRIPPSYYEACLKHILQRMRSMFPHLHVSLQCNPTSDLLMDKIMQCNIAMTISWHCSWEFLALRVGCCQD